MADKSFKVSFTLDEKDANYFRNLYREARKNAKPEDEPRIIEDVKGLIGRVRSQPHVPSFVDEAIRSLEDLMQMLEDQDYALPKMEKTRALAALAYFANPEDVIPDNVPGLGFLDDAIMIKFVEEEFRHELWAYRKFRTFRAGAEQRPWTNVAEERLPRRLEEYRKSLRAKVKEKQEKDEARALKAKAVSPLRLRW
jgi:uncharacterized membrane protein YkvA (DUF1232 family)